MNWKLLFLPVFTAMLAAVTGCPTAPASNPTPTPTPTLQNQQPIEVVSVMEPFEGLANPAGPLVEITLKNVSDEPAVSLSATLQQIKGMYGDEEFGFVLNVTAANPLMPDDTITSRLHLIHSGYSDNKSYPLALSGSLQSGATFAYSRQVRIKTQPFTNEQPIEFVSALGPVPPFNLGDLHTPGGWSAEITLKNAGDEPVIAVSVTLLTSAGDHNYSSDLHFDVTSSNPLLPGMIISAKGKMYSISGEITYSLGIFGTLQSGTAFHIYSMPIQINAP
ncbi:MAG: hypothetical protein PHR56_08110 [Dehalococcoidales bacterium]|nr:hypothetical protein [Dehalococcoidales bacterium]